MSTNKTRTGYRDADSGQFIKENEAKRNPKESVKERIPLPGHGDTGRGKKK